MVQEDMRGEDQQQNHMFSYLSPEARVRKDHPLRIIRAMMDEVLSQLSRRFDRMYARVGRPSIAPEKLLRAQLVQMLYSIRSERLLMEEMDYNLLFRWFVGLNADEEVWDATTFTKNRGGRRGQGISGARGRAGAGQRFDFRRAFHGGRYAVGGVGKRKEFPAEAGKAVASAG
jgi:transposase